MCKDYKYYILNMFPYPSGEGLHVGHPLGYVASDIYARYKKMKGYKVINPMGFDSFGLPAEQYAILTGQHPSITTDNNVNHYIKQMKNIDLDFDWDRKFNTSDPEYYKWTQWIFIKMFNSFYCKLDNKAHNIEDLYKYFEKNGTKDIENYVFFKDSKYKFTSDQWNNFSNDKKYKISLDYRIAYLDDIEVNWCEGLKTVLANDEVKNGVSERGGYPVIKKKMKQWVLRITAYADRLLDDLDYYYQKNEDKNYKDNIYSKNHLKVFKKNDLKPNLKIEERNIILAIIKHWDENKYLVIRYKKDNSRAFVTGGIESNETPEEAVIREIKEETGFINIRKIEKICNTDCTFYNNLKNVNRRAFSYNYYVELENGENIEVSEEEQNISDFEWVNEDDLENTISFEEEYYPFKIFKERQNNELLGVVKVFNSTLKEGLEIENRNVILAIIKHWNENKYLVIRYKQDNARAFLTGGIDDNEKIEDALIREIREETGFINIRKIEKICDTECTFYHARKNKNLKEFVKNYYVELENYEKIETSKEEQDILDFEWVNENELKNIINYEEHYYPFKIFKEKQNNELLSVDKIFNLGFKEGYPLINFNVICAVIKHWKEDKYLIIKYTKDNSTGFLTGKIEDGENNIDTLLREIKEETGFINFKRIIPICKTKVSLFVNRKNTNAEGFCSSYFVELKDDSHIEVSEEEKNKQTYFFVDEKDVENYLKDEDFKYIFNKLQNDIKKEVINWPESTKEMQRNWIGRSNGANVKFKVFKDDKFIDDYDIIIFTSRPETIFGVTFIGLSKDHDFIKKYCNNLDLTDIKEELDVKVGINTGFFAVNPFNNEKVPIWIANYILSNYGTGAIMGVPQLDDRDKDFAEKYEINIKNIFEDDHFINSDFLNNLNVIEARKKILSYFKSNQIIEGASPFEKEKVFCNTFLQKSIEEKVTYRLRDAIFSRQRYWGEPIPIYYKDCNIEGNIEKLPFTIDKEDLPLKLPDIDDYKPTGEAPLKRAKNWNYKGCELETNTMPGWAGSSWYFLRYLDPKNDKEFCSKEKLKEFENVDLYLGGSEHAVGHLLYSRFFTKFLYDLGYINFEEPFKKLIHQGMILGESAIIYRNSNNEYISSDLASNYENLTPIHINVNFVDGDNNVDIDRLKNWRPDFLNSTFIYNIDKKFCCDRMVEKMSKSKYNVINPDDIIEKYGSDVLRMYLMFLGPIEQQKPWNTKGIEGIARFLNRVNNITNKVVDKKTDEDELKIIYKCIKEVGENIENYSFNTAISSMMICLNDLSELENISKDVYKDFLLVLKPFAPKTVKNILNQIFKNVDIDALNFPQFNEKYLQENTIQYPVMINGKTRAQIIVNKNASEDEIKNIVFNNDIVRKWIDNKEIKKFIIVNGKIISIVI